MRIFETHSHLYMPQFDEDRDKIIEESLKSGVEYIINVAVDEDSFFKSSALSKRYQRLFHTIGFHPHDAEKYSENFIRENIGSAIAVGEIGLDYYRNLSPRNMQIEVFEKQVDLAKEYNKPIIIHDRDAHNDCLDILREHKAENVVFHSYTGDTKFAKKILDEGWFIAFNGIITFKNTHLTDVVKYVPLDRIFVETDSPYLSPPPLRGKRNSPLNLIYIIRKIAEIKDLNEELVAEITFENACNFFRIEIKKK